MSADNQLQHSGIKGMRWGVRRTDAELGHVPSSSGKKTATQKAREKARKGSKERWVMSDKDLVTKIGRLERQKKLRELTKEELAPGRNAVNQVLVESGKRLLGAAVTGATFYAIKSIMTKKFDISELATYLTPKPKK